MVRWGMIVPGVTFLMSGILFIEGLAGEELLYRGLCLLVLRKSDNIQKPGIQKERLQS